MAAKQILSLVVASTWVANLFITKRTVHKHSPFIAIMVVIITNGVRSTIVST